MPVVDQRTHVETERVIAVCAVCGTARAADLQVERVTTYQKSPADGSVSHSTRVRVVDLEPPFVDSYRGDVMLRCCGDFQSTRYVNDTESDAACSPRCEAVTGPDCECGCGGANHGRAHLT